MGKKTVRGHDIANRFVYSLRLYKLYTISLFLSGLPKKNIFFSCISVKKIVKELTNCIIHSNI